MRRSSEHAQKQVDAFIDEQERIADAAAVQVWRAIRELEYQCRLRAEQRGWYWGVGGEVIEVDPQKS